MMMNQFVYIKRGYHRICLMDKCSARLPLLQVIIVESEARQVVHELNFIHRTGVETEVMLA